MILTVLATGESIDAFDNLLTTQMRIRSGDPLAFDDCMGVIPIDIYRI
ncbi:hypothetical protein [Paraburkholderia ginsengisoli]|uniref:Uncharacterized protein n=1 Tax=Paraburkholderia ginsengisoli TaxID=311231 RepID=A0A7T4N303_9BURK|nr:hypothetical protein [Paraburkholderia ginsengisoli]QQC64316.1 hypothetical protein I6I06_02095 [Paraburkholderia ginsengisoli]